MDSKYLFALLLAINNILNILNEKDIFREINRLDNA